MWNHLFKDISSPPNTWYVLIAGIVGSCIGIYLKMSESDWIESLFIAVSVGTFFGLLLWIHSRYFSKKSKLSDDSLH